MADEVIRQNWTIDNTPGADHGGTGGRRGGLSNHTASVHIEAVTYIRCGAYADDLDEV